MMKYLLYIANGFLWFFLSCLVDAIMPGDSTQGFSTPFIAGVVFVLVCRQVESLTSEN